jgi:glycosyltransferase involved in cell wall biosynthesis
MTMVTIGVTTYKNRINFLNESILSILNQKYKNFNVIIANDSPEFPISKKSFNFDLDKRITIINNHHNLGEEKNLNYLLSLCKTPWFTWLADDDFLHPDFLSSKINFLEKNINQNIVAIYSNFKKVREYNVSFFNEKINNNFVNYEKTNFHKFFLQRKINCIGVYGLINTNSLKKINGIKKLGNSHGPFSDILLPLVLSKFGKIAWSPDCLCFFRTHIDSLSESNNYDAFYSAKLDFINEYHIQFKHNIENRDIKRNLFNFNIWFIKSIFEILKRDKTKNIYGKIKLILNLKKNIFYQDISLIMILRIILYIFKLILVLILINK